MTDYKDMTYLNINFSKSPDEETLEDFVDTLGTHHSQKSLIGSEDFKYSLLTDKTLEIFIRLPLPGISYTELIEKTLEDLEGLEITSFIACLVSEDSQKITYEVLREGMSGTQESTKSVDTFKKEFPELFYLPERFEFLLKL